MKSSQGEYFVGLDHIRALAAFTVFTWHFNHVNDGHLSGPEIFPLSFFAEGHVGVAVFMTLSGYLFAKLLDGRDIHYVPFMWNRLLRLFPLLAFVFVVNGLLYHDLSSLPDYLRRLVGGFVRPLWPNGGWSIAVELHFYLILPFLLAISSRRASYILVAMALSLIARTIWWVQAGSVQDLAYWTIIGGIDQFVMGIFAFKAVNWIKGRHVIAVGLVALVMVYISCFDMMGGFYGNQAYPSPSPIWIVHPTILAVAFAGLIAWYDRSFTMPKTGVSGLIAAVGACSYSIYLLHFFVVFQLVEWINADVVALTSFPMVLLASCISFLCFVPVANLSYRYIELPPLRFRTRYKRPVRVEAGDDVVGAAA